MQLNRTTQPTSPYARLGARLVDNGYAAIPCQPGSKIPGMCSFGDWWPLTRWDNYCDRLPTHHEIGVWERWPDAGICVALDHTIKVVDIDTDDPALREAILSAIPQSPVAKRGRKGMSLFFRGSAAIAARSFNVPGHGRAVDLLAHGKQTVIPPTLHPDTGQPYAWLDEDETLETTPPERLPLLPDDIVERLEAALEPFGYHAPVERDPVLGSADTASREVNNLALARLDQWVPALGLPRLKRVGQGYRAVAIFRPSGGGKPTHKRNLHLSLHPDGIVDFGDGDQRYTPISLVMAVSRCDFGPAFDWLRDKLGLLAPPIDVSALVRNGLAKQGVRVVDAAEVVKHAANDNPPAPTGGLSPDLTRVPGLVGDITQWILDTARNPSPTLALGASLSFVGALAGRRYEGPTGLRTNVYVVGLAGSGFGKDHPRAAVKALAARSGVIKKFFGGEQIMSSSALRNRVKKNPSLVYMIDEFGGFLRKITNPRAGNHEKEIADDLLKFTGSAASIFMGADYADKLAEPIYNPNVCLYGTSTPETFWKSIGSTNIADGFLPRFVVLDAGPHRPKPRDPLHRADAPPRALVDAIQALVVHKNGGNLNGMSADGSTACVPIAVPYGDGAKAVFDDFAAATFARMDDAPAEVEPIYARIAENAGRLALVVAVGCAPERPVITVDVMRWSCDVAMASARMLMDQAEDRVADNDRQAEYKRIRAIIAETGRKGATRTDIARKLKGVMDKRRMDDVLALLCEAGEVVMARVSGAKGGPRAERYWTSGLEPEVPKEPPGAA